MAKIKKTGRYGLVVDDGGDGYYGVYLFRSLDSDAPPVTQDVHVDENPDGADLSGLTPGSWSVTVSHRTDLSASARPFDPVRASFILHTNQPPESAAPPPDPVTRVELVSRSAQTTPSDALWGAIHTWTAHRMFDNYKRYVEFRACGPDGKGLGRTSYEEVVAVTREYLAGARLDADGTAAGESLGDLQSVDLTNQAAYFDGQDLKLPYLTNVAERHPELASTTADREWGDAVVSAVRAWMKAWTAPSANARDRVDDLSSRLSELERIRPARTACPEIDDRALVDPFAVELIWSYWQEEGGLVQTINHILARFQNRKAAPGPDPLARFDLSPLRPLRHLLFEWAETESDRLTVRRRAAEYEYEYGLRLVGRAVPPPGQLVERRNSFLGAFHQLLHVAHLFFRQEDDTTVNADPYPVLNALRETHLVLAEGAHNQYGDLPTVAREQMMIMQLMLAQPEMRDFLGGRPMVPYEEPWMDRVDTMKSLQGWTDTSVTHFRDLAVYGERLLLSIRLDNWNSHINPEIARGWARRWRPEVQRYVHAYRAATGIDLTVEADATMPSQLLAQRESLRARRA